jgi:hypothetical protein
LSGPNCHFSEASGVMSLNPQALSFSWLSEVRPLRRVWIDDTELSIQPNEPVTPK